MQQYPYDVALSFAGEDRFFAEALAETLRRHGIKVFYDEYEKSDLWGKNLYTYLSDVYQNKARYCVMFLSQHYATKLWTNHEREAAQARAFSENVEYILPVRLDDTNIPGILPTTAYVSWPPETAETIADMIMAKLSKPAQRRPQTKSVENSITHELPTRYEKEIQQQVGEIFDFRQAINARNWKQAEKILQKYPNLPEARSLLGLSMSQEVQEYFSYQLHPCNFRVGGPVTPLYRTQFVQTLPDPPKLEAIYWLEEALQYQDDPEGQATAALALMYGYGDAYDKMIDALQKACTMTPSLTAYFQLPDNLMMLIFACHNLASVEKVMRNIGLKLPKLDEVKKALREASDPKSNPTASAHPYIEWYAVEFRMGNSSGMPVKVLIAFPDQKGLTYAQLTKQGQATITIPGQPSSYAIETLIPVDEILKQLTDIGVVLITII